MSEHDEYFPEIEQGKDPDQLKYEIKLKRERELDDVHEILRTSAGERFFARILRDGKVLATTYCGDALQSAFLEGNRNFALRLFSDVIEISPDKIPALLAEGKAFSN